ncbi:Lrp/AsnC family transcriptional regulator, partial [Staphylococcus kloosii]
MDLTDEKIIEILEKDSKVSLNHISKLVNLSTPSVRERINKMKDSGIINNYTID